MKNPLFTKIKAIERTEKEPQIYIFTTEQITLFGVFCGFLGGLLVLAIHFLW